MKPKISISITTTVEKVKNKENFLTFLIIRKPTIKTAGSITGVATHQLAPNPRKVIRTAEIAAGLNRCFFLMFSTYLEDIARIEERNNGIKSERLFVGGLNRKNRIRAVIRYDSELVGILKRLERRRFEIKHVTVNVIKDKSINIGEKPMLPVKESRKAQITSIISP